MRSPLLRTQAPKVSWSLVSQREEQFSPGNAGSLCRCYAEQMAKNRYQCAWGACESFNTFRVSPKGGGYVGLCKEHYEQR